VNTALRAAIEVGRDHGIGSTEPRLIQETNNTVIWLAPHPVVAKVGTRVSSHPSLRREHAVAASLHRAGAPVAPPWPDAAPVIHGPTGHLVTLWRRLESIPDATASGSEIGASLRDLHGVLARCDLDLPSFRAAMEQIPAAIDTATALVGPDRSVLADAFDLLVAELDGRTFDTQPLHGEPHEANLLVTPSGIHWIDFENACTGPIEWDLAFLPDDGALLASFPSADLDLLALLRVLCSALVATWCWIQARFPEMRAHGVHHLAVVRRWYLER
jgi:hypothetical protein